MYIKQENYLMNLVLHYSCVLSSLLILYVGINQSFDNYKNKINQNSLVVKDTPQDNDNSS